MVRQMYANTPAANLEAVLQHRHQPHHGKTVADAGGKLEAIDHVEEAALSSNSSAPHLVEATIDGRSSRAVCLHAAAHWPMPKKIAGGLHCEHTQAWHACNKGFFCMYLPPAAIAHFHKRATAGIERSKTVFAIVAGPSAELLYTPTIGVLVGSAATPPADVTALLAARLRGQRSHNYVRCLSVGVKHAPLCSMCRLLIGAE